MKRISFREGKLHLLPYMLPQPNLQSSFSAKKQPLPDLFQDVEFASLRHCITITVLLHDLVTTQALDVHRIDHQDCKLGSTRL